MLRRTNSSGTDWATSIRAVQALRTRLIQKNQRFKETPVKRISPNDKRRIDKEDWWLQKFLSANNYDVDIAYAVIIECLKWRCSIEIETVGLLSIKSLLEKNLMYIHGTDIQRDSILWIIMEHYQSGEEGFDKLFAFWMERHVMDSRGSKLTIFIDMTKTTLKNMNNDIMRFMFKALKYYYPETVTKVIVFDSPPILNATWKVIRGWEDIVVPDIIQTTRESVLHYVNSSNLQPRQGGEDSFTFSLGEIAKCIPSIAMNGMNSSMEDLRFDSKPDLDNFPTKRAVKFDETDDEDGGRKGPLILQRRSSRGPGSRRAQIPPNLKPAAEKRTSAPDADWTTNSFVSINPRDELVLTRFDGENDLIDLVAIKNRSDSNVLFKIKTTSPEKFRVRPSTGIIQPGTTETVRVYLQNEYRHSCSKEKFLLMALTTGNDNNIDNFSESWKAAQGCNKIEHKLRCRVKTEGSSDEYPTHNGYTLPERKSSYSNNQAEMEKLMQQISTHGYTQKLLIVVIAIMFAFQIVSLMYATSNYNYLSHTIEDLVNKISTNTPPLEATQPLDNDPASTMSDEL